MTDADRSAGEVDYGTSGDDGRLFPTLAPAQWVTFALVAAVLAATNIYTTLLIGWGDTGSIVAALASFAVLGVVLRRRVTVHELNIGQTMGSAGGSVGFAVASYAAVYIAAPDFRPSTPHLIAMFATMGMLGAIIGSSVRASMVRYFFPSGTACAVIQTSIARTVRDGESNRPVRMLALWGAIATVATIPTKIAFQKGQGALLHELPWKMGRHEVGLGVDPLYYGIGVVVGPRVGLGMLLGALASPYLIQDGLLGTALEAETGDWVRWGAIAVLTLPTFATIGFAYLYREPAVVPPGFEPGRTHYRVPALRGPAIGAVLVLGLAAVAYLANAVFAMPYAVTAIVAAVAWPMCVVNGRVAGDTDINPVRLVAIVLLSAFFWLITKDFEGDRVLAMLGMAVVGGTLASSAVDMMQDYRTGYLVDANPTHQTFAQFVGTIAGALAAIPVLNVLLGQLGIGEGSSLPAPGASIWAAMGEAAAGGFTPSTELKVAIALISVLGCGYAFLTVWPRTARFMPSLFGLGIGMLLGVPASAAIFGGGLLKWLVTLGYTAGKKDEERAAAADRAGNDTMLAGASVFAAGAVVSIALVLLTTLMGALGLEWFFLAG
ncbi:MAG: OPT/YSL family transporter [Planctomycetota bacterium]